MDQLLKEIQPALKFIKSKRLNEAKENLMNLISIYPRNFLAFNLIGQIELNLKNFKNSVSFFKQGLKVKPDYFDLNFNLSNTLILIKDFKQAVYYLNVCRDINKSIPDIYFSLGISHKELNQFSLAKENYIKCLELDKNHIRAKYNLAKILSKEGNYEEAAKLYKKILQINPLFFKALLNLSNHYFFKKEYDKSLDYINKSLTIDPSSALSKYNKSLILLKIGKFKEGWELYENRWLIGSKKFIMLPAAKKPFNIEKILTEKLLIWFEQGLGDEIMFCSILTKFKDIKNLISCKCDQRLISLFKNSFPNINFYDHEACLSKIDFVTHIPAGSLFKYYKNNLSDFDGKPYLISNNFQDIDEKINQIKKDNYKIIGLSWKSSNKEFGDKSLDIEKMFEIFGNKKFTFVNLQYGDVSEDIEKIKKKFSKNIYSISDNSSDIDRLACLISKCDEVISIDNLTVQLSGSLGVKTRVLLHCRNDWRWLKNSNQSYWYRSLRIYHQTNDFSWDDALINLKNDLENKKIK